MLIGLPGSSSMCLPPWWCRWPTTFVPSLDAGPHPRPSLNRLTHDFLTVIEVNAANDPLLLPLIRLLKLRF